MNNTRPTTLDQLEQVYSEMNTKWINHPENWVHNSELVHNDSRTCLAIYSYDTWKLHPITWQRLQRWLLPLLCDGVEYVVDPLDTQGRLHFTFHQMTGFTATPYKPQINPLIQECLNDYLKQLSGLEIHFRGLILTPTGIALRGYPADSIQLNRLMRARDELHLILKRCGIQYTPPYINDICHATLFRWIKTPSQESISYLQSSLSNWNESYIATFIPKIWWIGNGTYTMTQPHVNNIESFYTPIYIAHRGLTDGSSMLNENNKENLLSRVSQGLYSECDIWYIDGTFLLGHDFPSTPISIDELYSPYLWLHAKNKDAYEKLLDIRNSRGINLRLFWHTNEDYILTTHNDCIVFPGKPLLKNSVFMMPENAGTIENSKKCSAICSDFNI